MNPSKLIGMLLAAAALAGLPGCDSKRISELEEGVSTEADVRARFGEPGRVSAEPDGGHTLEYTRQPEGTANYLITIDPQGRMSLLRQVLTPANFARIVPGMAPEQVRRALGQPARVRKFAARGEEVWEWRFLEDQQVKLFSVTFDKSFKVSSTATELDPTSSGGRTILEPDPTRPARGCRPASQDHHAGTTAASTHRVSARCGDR
jgi:hypothetical protein